MLLVKVSAVLKQFGDKHQEHYMYQFFFLALIDFISDRFRGWVNLGEKRGGY